MKRLHSQNLFAFIILFISSHLTLVPLALGRKQVPNRLKEVVMDTEQFEEASTDLPAKALVVDGYENIWFLGVHYLWKWSPQQKILEKIKLLNDEPLKHLALYGNNIYVSDDNQFFQIQIEPFKVFAFPPNELKTHSLGIIADQNPVYWVKTDGIYEISKDNFTMTKIQTHSLSDGEDSKFIYIPTTQTLWMTLNHELSYVSYGKKKTPTKFGKIEKNIYDIQRIQDEVFAIAPNAVFRFTKSGHLIQTVPVVSQRRIVLSSLQPNAHAYVFQDRLLEVQVPLEKKTFHFFLNIGKVHKATMMSLRKTHLGIILDGKPRAFEFANTGWAL